MFSNGSMLSALTSAILLFHIADDSLPTVIYMSVLDILMLAMTQASKNLNLQSFHSHSSSHAPALSRNM